MRVTEPLLQGILLRRYKRFLMDLSLPDGRSVTVHCANSGSMEGCLREGAMVLASPRPPGKGRLSHAAEWILLDDGWVGIHTHRANQIAGEALRARRIAEVAEYGEVRAEVPYGQERSRIDFLLTGPGLPDCYVEVKNTTWPGADGAVAFPDAVTERGLKHLRELRRIVRAGARGIVLFVVNRPWGDHFRGCHERDPAYAAALRLAHRAGVELLARRVRIVPPEAVLDGAVPVRL